MEKYRRPQIERVHVVNPDREAGQITDAEGEIRTIFQSRMTQQRSTFRILNYQYDAPFNYPNFRVEIGRPWENAANQAQPDAPEDEWGVLSV